MMTHIKLSDKTQVLLKKIFLEEGVANLNKLMTLEKTLLESLIAEVCNQVAVAFCEKDNLLLRACKCLEKLGMRFFFEGILDVLPKGYGFLRTPSNNFVGSDSDVYMPSCDIKKFSFKPYKIVRCFVNLPNGKDKYLTFAKPYKTEAVVPFEEMVPVHPFRKFNLHLDKEDNDRHSSYITVRLIDLLAPLAKGQRAIVVAPPKSGKTFLIKAVTKAIMLNHPEAELVVLLIDERPEEVTDFKQFVGDKATVIFSSFDLKESNHIKVAEMTFAFYKGQIEHNPGKDVVILVDSLTKLCKSFNASNNNTSKIMPGGLDPSALRAAKSLFGLGRQLHNGGSLTIIATVLMDQITKAAETIFEEFKGTGNAEVFLERELIHKHGIYPPIDISKTGTRNEDIFSDKVDLKFKLRRLLSKYHSSESLKLLIERIKNTKSNEAFYEQLETIKED